MESGPDVGPGDATVADVTLGYEALGNAPVAGSAPGGTAVAAATLGDGTVADATLGDGTVGDATLRDATLRDATLRDATVGDATVESPASGAAAFGAAPFATGPFAMSASAAGPSGPGPLGSGPAGSGPVGSGPVGSGPVGGRPIAGQVPGGAEVRDDAPGGAPRRRSGPRKVREGGPNVFARRWAVLVGVVALVVIILVVVLRGHPPALYWQGEPFGDGSTVLNQGQQSMQAFAADDEGVVSSQSRCYFSLPTTAGHDVAPYLRCGPVLLPWSSPSGPWLTYKLSASRPTSSGVELAVAPTPSPASTVALSTGEVLRRPDGTAPPKGDAGLAVPAVPRQPSGWVAGLTNPPPDLRPAPAADLIGDWGQSYRLVAFGELGLVRSALDPGALRVAYDPPGSAWSTGRGSTGRGSTGGGSTGGGHSGLPLAKLLLPPKGQVFVAAELAVSPGEDAGAVPVGAVAAGAGAGSDQVGVEVLAGTETAVLPAPGTSRAADLTIVAAVPAGTQPVLVVSDKGLEQRVMLATGALGAGPSVLARAGTDEPLSAIGSLPGVTVRLSDASLVWFAGSDGGTVPAQPDEAYLQVLATATPLGSSFLPASDFTLQLPGGEVAQAQALPDADREAIAVGFLVPASFSVGTVVVSSGGRSFSVPVHFQ